jgi:hypothetical protein
MNYNRESHVQKFSDSDNGQIHEKGYDDNIDVNVNEELYLRNVHLSQEGNTAYLHNFKDNSISHLIYTPSSQNSQNTTKENRTIKKIKHIKSF